MSGLRFGLRGRRGSLDLDVTIRAEHGQTIALLGPNGSGKSTIVLAMAGFVDSLAAHLQLEGLDLSDHAPEQRPIGVMFQDLRLFPHRSAVENVAFPLRARGVARGPARAEATALLDRLGLTADRLDARPANLSGGEAQRVALGRALIAQPSLLLLDEPTSALDIQAASRLRPLLGRTLTDFDGVCILVTHDPVEAMTLADTLVVLERGRVTQAGSPQELREAPRTSYVADLVGLNLFVGRLEPLDDGAGRLITTEGELVVAWPAGAPREPFEGAAATLRPAEVVIHTTPPQGGSARNILGGRVAALSIEGERARARVASSPPVVAEITLGSVERLGLREGTEVWVACKAVELVVRLPA
jgi:molybdate transport system ATP-binding protein